MSEKKEKPEWIRYGFTEKDFEDEEEWLEWKIENTPDDEDYAFSPCGPLGSKTCAWVIGDGEPFLGEFETTTQALNKIRRYAKKHNLQTDIWFQDDHGGMTKLKEFDWKLEKEE